MTGVQLIKAERLRQIDVECFGPEQDFLSYKKEELLAAAYCYLHATLTKTDQQFMYWPFSSDWWKPTTPQRNLVKAGALIAAHLDVMEARQPSGGSSIESRWLLPVWGGIEISLEGPYASEEARRKDAIRLTKGQDTETDGLFLLDLDGDGIPEVSSVTAGYTNDKALTRLIQKLDDTGHLEIAADLIEKNFRDQLDRAQQSIGPDYTLKDLAVDVIRRHVSSDEKLRDLIHEVRAHLIRVQEESNEKKLLDALDDFFSSGSG